MRSSAFHRFWKGIRSLGPRQKEQVKTITRSGRHLLELINDVLDLSKIEAGKLMNQVEVFCLRDLLEDLEAMFSVISERKGIAFVIDRSPPCSRFPPGGRGKLRQVLINILGNSFKFTAQGSVTVHLSLNTEENPVRLSVVVSDTGVGIREEDMKSIFDAFIQSDAGLQMGGTGLGLSITKRLIEIMGGSISVRSTYGSGTVFTFTVPVVPADGGEYRYAGLQGAARLLLTLRVGRFRFSSSMTRRTTLTCSWQSWNPWGSRCSGPVTVRRLLRSVNARTLTWC